MEDKYFLTEKGDQLVGRLRPWTKAEVSEEEGLLEYLYEFGPVDYRSISLSSRSEADTRSILRRLFEAGLVDRIEE